jgi:hypothetical protein
LLPSLYYTGGYLDRFKTSGQYKWQIGERETVIGAGERFILRLDGCIYVKFLCVRWWLEDNSAGSLIKNTAGGY